MNQSIILPLLLAFILGIAHSSTSPNLIVNGNFSKSLCTARWCIFKTNGTVEGWIPDPEIEVGDGNIYSEFITNEKVVQLAPNTNGCIYQQVKNIQPGNYELRFDHAARRNIAFDDCQFSVSFNGKLLKEFKHTNYAINREKLDVTIDKVTNASLRFCSIGGVSNGYGAIVKNVSFVQLPIATASIAVITTVPDPNLSVQKVSTSSGVTSTLPSSSTSVSGNSESASYVINGDFSKTTCQKLWCIFNSKQGVEGWTPEPEIEIGDGQIYSDYVTGKKVLELTPNANGCVSQLMKDVPAGIFRLRFEHAARKRTSFEDCMFSVYLNGKLLKQFKHSSYLLNKETIQVKIAKQESYNLKFCSNGGQNNGLGAILNNVSFVKLLSPTPAQQAGSILIPQMALVDPKISSVGSPVLIQYQVPTTGTGSLTGAAVLPTSISSPVHSTNQQTLTLKSHSGTCLQRTFDLKGGDITISFDYKLISSTGVKESTTFVTVNGKPIYKALPCNNGNSLKLQGSLPKGSHVIGFCPAGSIVDQPHEISLTKVSLTEKPSVLSQ